MEALKIHQIVEKDGEIKVTGIPCKKGQEVEMILLLGQSAESQEMKADRTFSAIKLKTKGYAFSRDLANER